MTIGDLSRSILKQAHETFEPLRNGAFYVQYRHGVFMLMPFGDHHFMRRYCYRCVPHKMAWSAYNELPTWTFTVWGECK